MRTRNSICLILIIALFVCAPASAWAAQSFEARTFSVTPGGELEFRSSQGDVAIRLWERNELSLTARGVESSGLKVDQRGNLISVDYRGHGRDARFELQVPVRFNLNLNTGGGDVTINGNLEGRLQTSTMGGHIRFEDVQGEATIKSSGGDISGGSIAGNSEIRTLGGDIRLGAVDGALQVNTQGGDIQIKNVANGVTAKTLGGDVEVGDVGGEADLSTMGGDIRVGRVSGRASLKTSGGDIRLRSSSGDVQATTAGGDLRLEGVTGAIEAKTAGGSIVAHLTASPTRASTLSSQGGDVTLYFDSGARATVEARIRIRDSRHDRRSDYGFQSDFPQESFQENKAAGEMFATYKINGGGSVINVDTVNGKIRILRSTAPQ